MPSHSVSTTDTSSDCSKRDKTSSNKKRTVSASNLSLSALSHDDFAHFLDAAIKPNYPTADSGLCTSLTSAAASSSTKRRFSEAAGGPLLTACLQQFRREADEQNRAADEESEARNRTTNSYLNRRSSGNRHHTLPFARPKLQKNLSSSQDCQLNSLAEFPVAMSKENRTRSTESSLYEEEDVSKVPRYFSPSSRPNLPGAEDDSEPMPFIDESNGGSKNDGPYPVDYDNSFADKEENASEMQSVRVDSNPPMVRRGYNYTQQYVSSRPANDEVRLHPLPGSDDAEHAFSSEYNKMSIVRNRGNLDFMNPADHHFPSFRQFPHLNSFGFAGNKQSVDRPEHPAMAISDQNVPNARVPRRHKRNKQNMDKDIINVTQIPGFMGDQPVDVILAKIEGGNANRPNASGGGGGGNRRGGGETTATGHKNKNHPSQSTASAHSPVDHHQSTEDCNDGSQNSNATGGRLTNGIAAVMADDHRSRQGGTTGKKTGAKKSSSNDLSKTGGEMSQSPDIEENSPGNATDDLGSNNSGRKSTDNDLDNFHSVDAQEDEEIDVEMDDSEYISADEGVHSPPAGTNNKSNALTIVAGGDLLIDGANFRADDEPLPINLTPDDTEQFIEVQSKHKRRHNHQQPEQRTSSLSNEKSAFHRNEHSPLSNCNRPMSDTGGDCHISNSGSQMRRNSINSHGALEQHGQVIHSEDDGQQQPGARRASIDLKKQSYSSVAGRRPMPTAPVLADFIDDQRIKNQMARPNAATTTRGRSSLQTSRTASPDRRPPLAAAGGGGGGRGNAMRNAQARVKPNNTEELRLATNALPYDSPHDLKHSFGEPCSLPQSTNDHRHHHGSFAKALLSPPLPPAVRPKGGGGPVTAIAMADGDVFQENNPKEQLIASEMTAATGAAVNSSGGGGRSWADIAKSKSPASTASSRASIAASSSRDLSPDAPTVSDRCASASSSISTRDDAMSTDQTSPAVQLIDNQCTEEDNEDDGDDLGNFVSGISGITFFYDPNEAMPAPADPIPMHLPMMQGGVMVIGGESMMMMDRGEQPQDPYAFVETMDGQTPIAGSPMFSAVSGLMVKHLQRLEPTSQSGGANDDDLNTELNEKTLVGREAIGMEFNEKILVGREAIGMELRLQDGRTVMLAPANCPPSSGVGMRSKQRDWRHTQMVTDLSSHWDRFLKGEPPTRYKDVVSNRKSRQITTG